MISNGPTQRPQFSNQKTLETLQDM